MAITEKDTDLSVITLIGVCFSRLLLLHLLLQDLRELCLLRLWARASINGD